MSFIRDLRAALREGLDDLLGSDPGRAPVDELLQYLEQDLAEARSELDLARQDERRLQVRLDQEQEEADRLDRQIDEALRASQDELATELRRRLRRVERGIEILEDQWEEHRELVGTLAGHINELTDSIQEVELRRDFLRSRSRVQQLRDRYQWYMQEFGLDQGRERRGWEPPRQPAGDLAEVPLEDPFGDGLDEDVLDDEAAPDRLPPEADAEPAPEPRGERGEIPRHDEEPPLRRPRRRLPIDEPEALPAGDNPWDQPARSYREHRRELLAEIDRQVHSEAVDAEIEDELARLKSEPRREVEAEVGPAPDEPLDEPPTVTPEPPARTADDAAADDAEGGPADEPSDEA